MADFCARFKIDSVCWSLSFRSGRARSAAPLSWVFMHCVAFFGISATACRSALVLRSGVAPVHMPGPRRAAPQAGLHCLAVTRLLDWDEEVVRARAMMAVGEAAASSSSSDDEPTDAGVCVWWGGMLLFACLGWRACCCCLEGKGAEGSAGWGPVCSLVQNDEVMPQCQLHWLADGQLPCARLKPK
jgi:hypothetical protein